jgi:tetratricopeptide (TPR) repeat protein
VADWREHAERGEARYHDGEARLPDATDDDSRQRQLTRMGNAAAGAGLAYLMAGERERAGEWFDRAVERYHESFPLAPPGSWGRPIAVVKARVLVGDWERAEAEAQWALEQGAAAAESPIGRYAACLALLVLGRNEDARVVADGLRTRDDFPAEVGDAMAFIAADDVVGYAEAIETVLESFETRDEYLEDLPVADTVMVLQAIAGRRGMAADLSSPLLPA